MSAPTLSPPAPPPPAGFDEPSSRTAPVAGRRADLVLLAVIGLLVAGSLPLARVYIGLDFARPVLAALLLSVGLSWAVRRSGAGPLTSLVLSACGYMLLVAIAFLPTTLLLGVLPTFETFSAARDLWVRGMELLQLRPAPTFAEDGLMLLTVSGVWWIAHVVEGLVFRMQAPLRAIGMTLVLWVVPLAVADPTARVWLWAVPLLLASAGLLLTFAGADLSRWGTVVTADTRGRARSPLVTTGWPVALAAIAAGAVLGGTLPGFDEPPWYEVRGAGGGTTLTTNPIVSIRSNLVALSEEPVARVTTPHPVYLRLTSLDIYSEREEWISDGIRGGPVRGRLPLETETRFRREVTVGLEVQEGALDSAIIVPAPYHPARVSGPLTDELQFDPSKATFTMASGSTLQPGDRYDVVVDIPSPPVEALEAVTAAAAASPAHTALPDVVPPEVAELARTIVDEAGATTPFAQAMAIQDELRTWSYSLDPPQGHGASAMLDFITQRIGYCEQYAGTMAVMLRTLGLPTRVAVGYTPGELVEPAEPGSETYQVRNANAHAWVEVLFGDLGWIAFEPTPRTDGNVLVPSEGDLAPTQTEAQEAGEEEVDVAPPSQETPDARPTEPEVPDTPEQEAADDDATSGGSEDPSGNGGWLALLMIVALGGAAVLAGARRGSEEHMVPAERVLAAVDHVHRIARATGTGPRPAETDAEFLGRLGGEDPDAWTLAAAAARARYATAVPVEVAAQARASADDLTHRLLQGRSRARQLLIQGRAGLARTADRVRTVARRLRR